jgi:putative transcriptional regulator
LDRQYIASKLVELRKKSGLTQKEVSERIGVSESSYSQYETGDKLPRDDVKVAISKLFNRSVQFIFFSNDTREK